MMKLGLMYLSEEAVEGKGKHIHELVDEAQHSQGEVPDRGREELDAVDRSEGIPKAHDDLHEDIQQ
jgi:hypothetical protein